MRMLLMGLITRYIKGCTCRQVVETRVHSKATYDMDGQNGQVFVMLPVQFSTKKIDGTRIDRLLKQRQ